MTNHHETTLRVIGSRFIILKDQWPDLQQALSEAAQAGQSPHPYAPGLSLISLVSIVWGLNLYATKHDGSLTRMDVPSSARMQTFDTFLSLLAPFVAKDQPTYFEIVLQGEEGDRAFFYHVEEGQVQKQEWVMQAVPQQLDIKARRDMTEQGEEA